MSALTKFVKKYEVLIGMGLLMGCVQVSWNMMQHQMETGEQNKESPWLRVSYISESECQSSKEKNTI